MKELFKMWSNTRMIVLTAITGGAYAAIMIPFKGFQIIPGFTEIRPANVVPCLCSFLFGPAAAWGAGFGNVIGDLAGAQLGFGSIFGFFGNLLLAYVPYRAWLALSEKEPLPRGFTDWVRFLSVLIFACAALSFVIAAGLQLLGLMPFAVMATTIFLNSFLVNALLCAPLLFALYPRVKQMGLLYTDVMAPEDLPRPGSGKPIMLVFFVIVMTGMIYGIGSKVSERFLKPAESSASQTAPAPEDTPK